ncbi:hypothetical protein JSE7799_00203 [Jannaschia seosinensis]|uniref:Peptidyl-prolyl cis-trans isomerase SurA n=1 Tax=Jannaschia seosinensis TaxID=313367 RepID=A0A0M7B4E3_9RHOB|nr:hypothetical protein [Jannaschia seosinensis]CUH12185.1 hypothetical protein JSE7799_00203 [Jannaschia seosinensis]
MTRLSKNMRSTALAAFLSLPVATGAAYAQQSQDADEPMQEAPAQQSGQTAGSPQADAIVATVGDAEIRGADLMTVIGALPPQLQSQPPQMLVPMALEQLILRELILQEARGQNLADDPEVVALVEGSAEAAEEDAIVQVWLNRELASAVTDEAVQQAYESAQAQGQQDLPPVEEVRPQIEQYLRQQALQDVQARLQQDADIVLYDPTGRPVEQQEGQGAQNGGNNSISQDGGDSAMGGNSSEQSNDSDASDDEN